MTNDGRYPNPCITTLSSGGKASTWICGGRFFEADTWTAEIVFKRKPEPLKKDDRVKLVGSHPAARGGLLVGTAGEWGWVIWDDMQDTDYPRTISLGRLERLAVDRD